MDSPSQFPESDFNKINCPRCLHAPCICPPASQQTVQVQPVPQPTFEEMMNKWYALMEEMRPLAEKILEIRTKEQELRKNIIAASFKPEPGKAFLEGTQYRELGNGYRLKADLKIERKVQEDKLTPETCDLMKNNLINLDELLRVKHEVNVKPMRQLTAEQQKLFDTLLVITQPMPTMEVVPPKEQP